MSTPPKPHYLLIGEILRPHGVRGELRLRILTDYPERVNDLEEIYIGKDPNAPHADVYHVEKLRVGPDYGLLKLREINDRDEADRLRQRFVMVTLDNAVPLEEGEFYLFQLIGMTVQTAAGDLLGTIKEVLETGANDVYIIEGERYGEFLFPVTEETVVSTDVQSRIVTVNLPEGLIDSA